MNILHITRDFPPESRGGISIAVGGLVHALAQTGHTSSVLSFDGWRPRARQAVHTKPVIDKSQSVPVVRVTSPIQVAAALPLVESYRPDLIHVHHAMLWDVAAGLARRLGCPALLSVHVIQAEAYRRLGLSDRTLSLDAEERAVAEAIRIHVPTKAHGGGNGAGLFPFFLAPGH